VTGVRIAAYDRVRVIDKRTADHERIKHSFKSPVPLFYVALLATVVDSHNASYASCHILVYDLIHLVLAKRFGSQSAPLLNKTNTNTNCGTWWTIPIVEINESQVALIYEELDSEISDLKMR
jgi:hypothetical protein